MSKLFCMGNPLLDIQPNDQILAEEKHKPLYEELVKNYQPVYVAGGATQNAARGVQYLLPPKTAVYFGCVGDDEFSKRMREVAEAEGLVVDYLINKEVPTAAEKYNPSEHLYLPEKWKIVENAEYFYIAGFFVTVSPESIEKVAKHAAETNKAFAMNLSAVFLMTVPPFKKETDIKEIALKIAKLPKVNTKRQRIVIITQGSSPTILAYQNEDRVHEFKVNTIADDEIVDTNGAGDAFVGGFLSQFIEGKSVEESIEAGHWLAKLNLKQIGPSLPKEKIPYTPKK
ncbi:12191_t:CDS:2 [Entrophospora sp. SA101]|nr:12191_t:CDS:2 [Entrophospora sp. SA101]